MTHLLAQNALLDHLPPIVAHYIGWWVCALAVVLGLGLLGWRDAIYFSAKRVWAISSVSFSEAIRRRVLWITPLAILGVVVIAQLQRPMDEQDAIRQTIKFCIFATGMVVTMVVIILACTNLPKEIETRVIFTVVTKPATRLEIVLGKIVGFARVSAVILLIMGLFTWGYLHLRAWRMQGSIAAQLRSDDLPEARRIALRHYQEAGLLAAKQLHDPTTLAVFAKLPAPQSDVRWVYPNEMSIAVPFSLSREQVLVAGTVDQVRPVHIVGQLSIEERVLTPQEAASMRRDDPLAGIADTEGGPMAPTTQPLADQPPIRRPTPTASISIVGDDFEPIVQENQVNSGLPVALGTGTQGRFAATLTPSALGRMVAARRFYVLITGQTTGVLYGADRQPVRIVIGPDENGRTQVIEPLPSADGSGEPSRPLFMGRGGNYGQQLPGGDAERRPVAIYSFAGGAPEYTQSGQVPFELRVGIERSGADVSAEDSGWTHLQLRVRNVRTDFVSEPIDVYPETGRTNYFFAPRESVQGGDFQVQVRNLTEGHWVGLRENSLWLITDNQPFGYNLFKSMLILWLMTVLVATISIFCSTFLSWPIAIVLTVVILLGHWGVSQLQGSLQRGIGNQIATDFGFTDPGKAKVVSSTVEALTASLNAIAPLLPDISQYSATEDVERGVAVPPQRLWTAARMTLWFGLPLAVLAYVFLRYKEVAP